MRELEDGGGDLTKIAGFEPLGQGNRPDLELHRTNPIWEDLGHQFVMLDKLDT